MIMIEPYASLHIVDKKHGAEIEGLYSYFRSRNLIIYLDPTSPFSEDTVCRMVAHA